MGKTIRGCHVLAKGNLAEAAKIAPDVIQRGLFIGQSMMGTGAWAFYLEMVPRSRASKPMVVFEVDDARVQRKPAPLPNRSDYAVMRILGQPLGYVKVNVLGFKNVPGFPDYNGPIGVV